MSNTTSATRHNFASAIGTPLQFLKKQNLHGVKKKGGKKEGKITTTQHIMT